MGVYGVLMSFPIAFAAESLVAVGKGTAVWFLVALLVFPRINQLSILSQSTVDVR